MRSLVAVAVAVLGGFTAVPAAFAADAAGGGDEKNAEKRGSEERPFKVGEKLSYDVTLLGIRAAEVRLGVDELPKNGFRFVASGKTVGATDSLVGAKQDAMCSVDRTLTPTLCRFTSENRSGVRRRELRFDSGTGNVRERTLEEGKRQEKEIHFDSGLGDVQDALSGLYLLRSQLPERPGEVVMFRSMRKGKPITVEAKFVEVETVETEIGTFETAQLDLRIVEEQEKDATTAASVWLTMDARRLPVKMSAAAPIGTLEATLTSAFGTVEHELARR